MRADANVAQGYRPRGVAWYRRTFRLEEAVRGQAVELRLDGIASHATVWVNGMLLARSWSGYNGLVIDITPVARYGNALNSIAIRVDAEAMDGWWYEGGGIYRHTWLVLRAPPAYRRRRPVSDAARRPGRCLAGAGAAGPCQQWRTTR